MSRSFDGTNDTLRFSGVVADATAIETTPITFACWVKRGRTSNGTAEFLMISGPTNVTNHYIALGIETDNTVWARTRTTGTSQAVSSATVADTSTWHLLVAVFASVTSRTIYVDGNTGVNDTGSRDPVTATDLFSIGCTLENTFGAEYQGLIAYATVWNKALSAGEVTSLYNGGSGVDPTTIAGANLVAAWDLTGNESPEIDDVGAFDLTVTAATFSSDNPFTVGGGAGQAARTSSFMRMMQNAGGGL